MKNLNSASTTSKKVPVKNTCVHYAINSNKTKGGCPGALPAINCPPFLGG